MLSQEGDGLDLSAHGKPQSCGAILKIFYGFI